MQIFVIKLKFFLFLCCSYLLSSIIFIIPSFAQSSAPTLVYPKSGVSLSDTTVNLEWNTFPNSSSYHLQVSTDNSFIGTKIDRFGIISTIDTVNLSSDSIYYWRVQADTGAGFSNWSFVYDFTIFNPTDINGLKLWLKSDYGITSFNDSVSSWSDLSGQGNDAIQSDPNRQPISFDSVINNYPGIRFDNVDDGMSFPPSLSFSSPDSFSIFTVYNYRSSLSAPGRTIQGLNNWLIGPYTGSHQIYAGGFVSGPSITPYRFVYQSATQNPSLIKNYVNGVLYGILSTPSYPGQIGLATSGFVLQPLDGDLIEVIVYNDNLTDSLRSSGENYLRYKYAPPVNLGRDISACDTFYTINAYKDYFISYLWNDGSTDSILTVYTSGIYYIVTTDIFGYASSDSINIIVEPPPVFSLGNDTAICYQDFVLNSSFGNSVTYLWSDSTTDSSLTIVNSGIYWLNVQDSNGCSYGDSINIVVDTFALVAFLGPDTTFCSGNSISLQQGASQAVSYLWSDSTTGSTLTITSPGDYWVTVFDSLGCSKTDTINVNIQGTAPIADFYAPEVCHGFNTVFADSSSVLDSANIISWLWNFGDSSISTFQNPTHLYDSAGTYSVTLTVITDSGCSSNTAKTVDVNVLPQANFSPLSGCSGAGVPFSDLSSVPAGSITGWQWDFGDGDTSTLQNPAHVFADSGSYNVKLSVFTNNGCVDSITQIVTIKKSPVAAFTYSTGCNGEFLTFTDTSTATFPWSIISWSWDFGDFDTSALPNPVHLYADTGMYNVSLTVQALDGCVDTVVTPVIVNPAPVANFTGGDLCINTPYQFIDSSFINSGIIDSWYWDFDGLGTSTAQNPLFAFTDTGSRPVNLTVTSSDGCTNSFTDTVEVRNTPVVDFIFSPSFGTPPLTVSFTSQSAGADFYNWDFGDGNTSFAQNPTNMYTDSGIYTIQLNASDSFGCNDSAIKTIKVLRTILDIAVADVTTNLQSNYLTISVNLSNLGTRDITGFELHAQINGGTAIREDWAGLLPPGQKTTYDFNAGFVLPGNFELRYVCVSALNPNSDNDDVPSNNEQCVIFSEGFLALEPYPNPTDNDINIEYIIPYSEFVEVVLYDEIGKRVSTLFSDKAGKGLNKILLDASILNSGMYFYRISFIDQTVVKRFVVSQ